eukprot:scaffold107650_cov39-Prasinocladus_malaysianus.AAC.1
MSSLAEQRGALQRYRNREQHMTTIVDYDLPFGHTTHTKKRSAEMPARLCVSSSSRGPPQQAMRQVELGLS